MLRLLSALTVLLAATTVAPAQENRAIATFAGGCFWCVEADFDKVPGVISTTSGYTGGTVKNPTYHQVSAGGTGHAEAVEVVYDPAKVNYAKLLDVFWHSIDPLVKDKQFCDTGDQYRTAIFYHSPEQEATVIASKERMASSGKFSRPIATEIVPAGVFYAGEDYHQQYLEKRGLASCHIR